MESERGSVGERVLAVLGRRSLRSLLAVSAGLVVAYCALVVVLNLSQARTIRLMDTLAGGDFVVAELSLESTAALIDARRLEKDFLLDAGEHGFPEAKARYLAPLAGRVARIRANMARVRALAGDATAARQATEVAGELDRHLETVEALAAKLEERGSPESGVYRTMREEAQALERIVKRSGDDALLAGFLASRRAERYFVERVRDADAEAVTRAIREVVASAAGLPDGPRRELRERAERYLGLFGEYVRATGELAALEARLERTTQTISPLLASLYADSLARAAARRRAIARSTRLLGLPVVVGGGVLLGLVALLSLGTALSVTRAVARSRRFAERIASGDLDTSLEPEGSDEFSELHAALNAMARSLRDAEAARVESVAALQRSEERHRAIVETSTDWIWETDREGRHTFSNDRVRELLGIEPAELLQAPLSELLHPEDAGRARALLEQGVAAGRGWEGVVLRWRHRDGTWRWIESNAVAIRDAAGETVGFRGVDRDVTGRRRLEGELVKIQKLEAIGVLAGGIAHDFNNLLQGLFGYISLARQEIPAGGDEARSLLDQAERALTLSVNLTTQLLTFAKGGRPVKERIALGEIIEDPVKFALSGSPSGYRLDVAGDLAPLDADAGQLAQVIQNIVLNASEAMPAGGTVEVAARNASLAPGSNPLVPSGGDFVRIDVRDSGAGIDGRHLAQIFDPYFTTKEKGSGLGLATSYSIVRNHGGFIDVASSPGEGSVFSLYLPAAASAGPTEGAPEAPSGLPEARGRILVMDDEDMVRNVTARMLQALGHAVETAADGEEALERYHAAREAGRPFDVVLLDLTVKEGMGGEETLRRLRAVDPGVTAVVSSGYAETAAAADYRAHGFAANLGKPYRAEDLRACLRGLLRPPAGGPAGRSRRPS